MAKKKSANSAINLKKVLRLLIVFIIVAGIIFFFTKELLYNWAAIKAHQLKFNLFYILLSLGLMLITYISPTWAWIALMNSAKKSKKFSLGDGIGIFNTTQLMKYLPGKLWSYAVQLTWLSERGFSKAFILYVNLFLTISGSFSGFVVGFIFLYFSFLKTISILSICLVTATTLLIYFIFSLFWYYYADFIVNLVNKILKKEIKKFDIPLQNYFLTQLCSFISTLALGVSGYFLYLGIGFPLNLKSFLIVMTSIVFADVIGFLVLIVPGGFGVREGLMYIMLKNSDKVLSLILPIASRIVIMAVDVILGVWGLFLLRNYLKRNKIKGKA